MSKSSTNKPGLIWRIARWPLSLLGVLGVLFAVLVAHQMTRPLELSPGLREALTAAPGQEAREEAREPGAEADTTSATNTITATLPVMWDRASTPTLARDGVTSGTRLAAPPPLELIAEVGLTDPDKLAKAREINALYKRFTGMLDLYERDYGRFHMEFSPASANPFDYDSFLNSAYFVFADRLRLGGFGEEAVKRWGEQYLQWLVHYEDWETAAVHCLFKRWEQGYPNAWDDMVYCCRRMSVTRGTQILVTASIYRLIITAKGQGPKTQ